MGNVNMDATQINDRTGASKMSVAQHLKALDAIASAIEGLPTFTSNDRAFLEELPAFPSEDGKKALVATTSSGGTSLNYEELSDLPADPETDGVRVLTATTSNGDTAKSWEMKNSGDYSTTEQKTGQKWIDGRDVYIRTFDFSSNPITPAFNTWTSLGVSMPNVDILLKCNATSGVTNLSSSGIEFEVKRSENYGLYAEYNQNSNLRSISYLTCEYVKDEVS